MGEGFARAITIISIVLTVASLTLAVASVRKRSRIRVGFDLARAVVGVAAILVMGIVTRVTTPIAALVLAVVFGLVLGFAQGSAVEVRPGERGFYARRSPVGIVLWGAGIVVMQAAGIAARAGTVRVGQIIAWFSACLGIGLIVGRDRPLRRARLGPAGGAAVAVVLLTLALTAALAGGALARHALAAQEDLTAEQLCDLYPQDQGFRFQANPGVQTCWADFGAGSGIIKQETTAEDALGNLTRHSGGYQESIAGLGEAAIGGCDSYCTVEFVRGRYWVWWSVDPELGLESARALAAQVDARLVALLSGEPPPAGLRAPCLPNRASRPARRASR